jgi:hypothetical protein
VCLPCQLITGKLVRKNRPMQVAGFVVDLAGKCVEGMQMNWASYLDNELEKDCREAQDQGYEFHFSWLLILIAFVAWEMPEGTTFPKVEPSEPLAARFTTLWYSSDMAKQWQSNVVFHTYYLHLTHVIESFPRMTPNTLHTYKPLAKFCADCHFIYITVHKDESKQELQSYYNLTEEDLEEITKEWSAEFLVPVGDAELFDPDLIGSVVVTRTEYDGPSNAKKKKKEKVQNIDSEEKENTSEETVPDSPRGGAGDEVNQEEEGEEDKQEKGEVTPSKDPVTEAETSKKMKVSPKKPSARKKYPANKPKSQNVLTMDDVDLIIAAVEDASKGILQRHEAKQETVYDRIEAELKGVQQAIYSNHAVSTVPSSLEVIELGDEPTQLRRLADATKT